MWGRTHSGAADVEYKFLMKGNIQISWQFGTRVTSRSNNSEPEQNCPISKWYRMVRWLAAYLIEIRGCSKSWGLVLIYLHMFHCCSDEADQPCVFKIQFWFNKDSNIQLGNHRDGTKQCAHKNNFSLFFNIAHSAHSFKYLNANCRLNSRSSSDWIERNPSWSTNLDQLETVNSILPDAQGSQKVVNRYLAKRDRCKYCCLSRLTFV